MIDPQLIAFGRGAMAAAQAGDRARALSQLDGFAQILSLEDGTTPFEFASMLALISQVYMRTGDHLMASLNLADVCAYAERHFPNTRETAIDYHQLSSELERVGDMPGALRAMEQAARHLSATPEWPTREPAYLARLDALRSKARDSLRET